MLVDFAVEREKHGMSQREAIIDAGRKRARPIVMTTIAMVAGMAPAALGTGEGGEFRAPMAIAVIGGLLVSTALSLVFIPSFYTIMDDLGWLVGKVLGWAIKPNSADEGLVVANAGHDGTAPAGEHAPMSDDHMPAVASHAQAAGAQPHAERRHARADFAASAHRPHLVPVAANQPNRRQANDAGNLPEAAE
jgi:hypothetical protein